MKMNITTVKEERANPLMQEEEIDLRYYWNVITRYKWSILSLALIVSLLTGLAVYSMQPIYRATATLLIEAQQAKVVSIEEIYGIDSNNKTYYQTQYEVLKSRGLAEKVINNMGLANHAEFSTPAEAEPSEAAGWRDWLPSNFIFSSSTSAEPSDEDKLQGVIDDFLSRLTITPVRKTQLVKISFEATNAKLAANIANAMADVYIESHLEARLEMTAKATDWLTERMGGLKTKLTEAEQRLQAFRDKENLVDVKGVQTLVSRELEEITSKLVEARERLSEAESSFKQVKTGDDLESIPAIMRNDLVRQLKTSESQARTKIAELDKRYGQKHPTMLAAKSELENIRHNLSLQMANVVAGFAKEYEVAQQNERALKRAMQRAMGKMQNINRKEYELGGLERDVEANRKLYDTFFTRFQETSATEDFDAVNARLLDRAVTPKFAAKPKKKMAIMIAFMVSLILGVMLAFLIEHLDHTFKGSAEIEEKLGLPMLGLVPMVKTRGKGTWNPVKEASEKQHPGFTESVRTVRTGLLLSGLDNPHKLAVITSSVPAEGKTTVAVALATAIGQLENTLLIDADMRRPSVGKMFGIAANRPGLSDLVAGTAELTDCIQSIKELNIDILSAGSIPPNPLELLSSSKFKEKLQLLETHYGWVIIDSPPVQAVSDALIMATHANALIYVVKADSTPYHVAKSGIKRLQRANAPITGIVLNQLDIKKAAKYGAYKYYGGYYDDYGYSSNEESKVVS